MGITQLLLGTGRALRRAAEAGINNNNNNKKKIFTHPLVFPLLKSAHVWKTKTLLGSQGLERYKGESCLKSLARSQSAKRWLSGAVCTAAAPKSYFTAAAESLHRVFPDFGSGLFLAARLLKTLEPETISLCPHVCYLLL